MAEPRSQPNSASTEGDAQRPRTTRMYTAPRCAVLENESVRLSALSSRHVGELWHAACVDSAALFHHLFFGPFDDKHMLRRWVERNVDRADRPTYAIFSKRLDTTVGICSILSIDTSVGAAEIGGIWCAGAAHGTEVVPSTVVLILAYLFDTLGYRRAVWKCDQTNLKSRGAAEHMGFVYEGTFRNHMLIKGRLRDTAWYSIIDAEWATVRAKLQARIAAKLERYGAGRDSAHPKEQR